MLKSAFPLDGRRFHVAVQPSRLSEYRQRSEWFALVFYKPKLPDTCDYIVIPFVRVRVMFTKARQTAKDGGWDAHVSTGGLFRTGEDRTREIDVSDCLGAQVLPQRVLRATIDHAGNAEIEAALQELSRR